MTMTNNMTEHQEEELAGKKVRIGRAVQNVQLEARAKGKPIGSVSARQILEMADCGELEGIGSVETLRRFIQSQED